MVGIGVSMWLDTFVFIRPPIEMVRGGAGEVMKDPIESTDVVRQLW